MLNLQKKSGTGQCHFCVKPVAATAMPQHLERHLSEIAQYPDPHSDMSKRYIHVAITHELNHFFWMNLLIQAQAPVHELDTFIRETWVECCRHDSRMDFRGRIVHSPRPERPDQPDRPRHHWRVPNYQPIMEVMPPGVSGQYLYDSHHPTVLKIEAKEMYRLEAEMTVILMARNPNPPCSRCSQPSTSWQSVNSQQQNSLPRFPYCRKCVREPIQATDEPAENFNNTPRAMDSPCFSTLSLRTPGTVTDAQLASIQSGEQE